MINLDQARKIASEHIESNYTMEDKRDVISIVDDLIVEKEWGWIFIYQSRRWIDTRDRRYMVLGLCPIVVEKYDGGLYYLDEGTSMEECVHKYEFRRKIKI
jgi:hypothetical protein